MALALLLLCTSALGAGADLYQTPSGRPCDSWRGGKPYQRAIWKLYKCGGGTIRWADKGGKHG
jgi:hypothetical protein